MKKSKAARECVEVVPTIPQPTPQVSDFAALEFNYRNNRSLVVSHFRLPLLKRLLRLSQEAWTACVDEKEDDVASITATLQTHLKDKRWSVDDIVLLSREASQGVSLWNNPAISTEEATNGLTPSGLLDTPRRFHFVAPQYLDVIPLDQVLHDTWKAHRKLMFWSKLLEERDQLCIEEVENPVSRDETATQLLQLAELCLEKGRMAGLQRSTVFLQYMGQTPEQMDLLRVRQLQLMSECVEESLDVMLCGNHNQSTELRFLPVRSTNVSDDHHQSTSMIHALNSSTSDVDLDLQQQQREEKRIREERALDLIEELSSVMNGLNQNIGTWSESMATYAKAQQRESQSKARPMAAVLIPPSQHEIKLLESVHQLCGEQQAQNKLLHLCRGALDKLIEIDVQASNECKESLSEIAGELRSLQETTVATQHVMNKGVDQLENIKWNTTAPAIVSATANLVPATNAAAMKAPVIPARRVLPVRSSSSTSPSVPDTENSDAITTTPATSVASTVAQTVPPPKAPIPSIYDYIPRSREQR